MNGLCILLFLCIAIELINLCLSLTIVIYLLSYKRIWLHK